MNVVLLHESFDVVSDQPEPVPRHAGHGVVFIVEVKTTEEPVKPARSSVIDINFDLTLRKTFVFLFCIYLLPWLKVMIC